jgi:hypothetical protein
MKKFAFVSLPSMELEKPPAAAAALMSCVKEVGWECKIFDFNLFLNQNSEKSVWQELESYWRCKILVLSDSTQLALNTMTDLFFDQIIKYNPTMLGASVFSKFSTLSARHILSAAREKLNCKLVIGGHGVNTLQVYPTDNKTEEKNYSIFGEYALHNNLTDYYIKGDGEVALMELLKGNETYSGINGATHSQVANLMSIPHPDYTGIEPEKYFYTDMPGIYITASRGCVRKCTFCNVTTLWPKFKIRESDDVVEEILKNKKKFNVDMFHFTDSLINGNMKEWREFNRKLIIAKENDPSLRSIKYMGQFICRTRFDQTEKDWELMAKAGAHLFTVGLETFSHKVRKHMGKNYSNSDIDFHFAQSAKYGIKNVLLMFIGYPTETLEDHEKNIEFLYRYQKYARAGIIHMVRWGYTGLFPENHKISNSQDVEMMFDPDFKVKLNNIPNNVKGIALGFGWLNRNNPSLTLYERIRRRIELHELSVKLGWPQTRSREELQILYNILKDLNNNIINYQNLEILDNFLDFH